MTELLSYVKKRWWVIFVISILCLILPYILRYYIHELPMAGEQSYDLARYVELHSDTERDPLLPSRSVTFTPYHYLLKGINYFFPFEFFQQWLPLIFGLITIVSMFFLMKQIQMDDTTLVCIAIIMIFAPVTVFTFFIPDYTGMVIALFSVALFLLNGKRYLSWIIGLLVLSFIPFFGIYEVVFCLGWLIVLFMYERKKPLLIGATLLIGGITLLLLWKGPIYLVNHSPVVGSFFKESISDFGGRIGISAFMYVLAILGFFYAWKQKKKLYPLYGMCIVWFVIAGHHPLVYMFFSLVGAY
ncbi:hypothetical protein COV16_03390, partial [Candidatus Woesearchaeota archaeon CG10_big_fil_rev_8_21_14_0_10_34_8]